MMEGTGCNSVKEVPKRDSKSSYFSSFTTQEETKIDFYAHLEANKSQSNS